MSERQFRSSRFRLAVALVVAMLGAIIVQTSLTRYVASMDVLGGAYCLAVPILYGLVFSLAYWIAPKWG
jgi:hypothetical protein